jgi:hypothetical protein
MCVVGPGKSRESDDGGYIYEVDVERCIPVATLAATQTPRKETPQQVPQQVVKRDETPNVRDIKKEIKEDRKPPRDAKKKEVVDDGRIHYRLTEDEKRVVLDSDEAALLIAAAQVGMYVCMCVCMYVCV